MGDYYGKKDGMSWREIILEHVRKILECSRTEFRGGFWNESGNNPPIRTYIFDTRATYINGVNSLADVLLPFFDEDMQKVFDDHEEKVTKEKIKEQLEEDYGKEEIDRIETTALKLQLVKYRLAYARKLFQELNKLLRRTDYLKSAIYQEEDDDEEEEEKE